MAWGGMHSGERGDARASCASPLGTPLRADNFLLLTTQSPLKLIVKNFMFIFEALEKVQKEEKGRMGGGRMGGKAPPPPKLDKAEEDSKAFSKELARLHIFHFLHILC